MQLFKIGVENPSRNSRTKELRSHVRLQMSGRIGKIELFVYCFIRRCSDGLAKQYVSLTNPFSPVQTFWKETKYHLQNCSHISKHFGQRRSYMSRAFRLPRYSLASCHFLFLIEYERG
jgi:hypothetical protein